MKYHIVYNVGQPDKDGWITQERCWIIVDETNTRVSKYYHKWYGSALEELERLRKEDEDVANRMLE
jgi:hypothetical protein